MNSDVGNQEFIKKINRRLVLKKIKESDGISRAQIAKELMLSKTTVSAIADEFIAKKMIIESGKNAVKKGSGRPAKLLIYNPRSAYGIGVDIGGTKILVIITDLSGETVLVKKVPTTNSVEQITTLVEECISEAGLKSSDIFGMGVGVPGTVSPEGVVIRAKSLRWFNLNLKEQLAKHFDFPIFIGNDVNYAAIGEQWKGSGDRASNMYFISIGTGIGSAIISDDRIVRGYQYRAGELGYFIDIEDVRQKNFNVLGELGTFEKKVSGTALGSHGFATEELFQKFSSGDPKAADIIREFVIRLSIVIANAICILNQEKVVLGGGVSESLQPMIYEIAETVGQLIPMKADICLATLGSRAGALGAIADAIVQVEES